MTPGGMSVPGGASHPGKQGNSSDPNYGRETMLRGREGTNPRMMKHMSVGAQ